MAELNGGQIAGRFRGFIASLFCRPSAAHQRCEPTLTTDSPIQSTAQQPWQSALRTDSLARSRPPLRAVPSVEDLEGIDPAAAADLKLKLLPVEAHATRFLAWLHADYPKGATLDASLIMKLYAEFCLDQQIATRAWISVARWFRPLCGGKKTYRSEARNRVRVYEIPAIGRRAERAAA